MGEFKFGDRVAYSRAFLQSTGQYTGAAPFARGTVKAVESVGDIKLARIHWDNPQGLGERVNVKNLVRADRLHLEPV